MEIWKDIVGWDGKYQISSLGRVKTRIGKLVSQTSRRDGWLFVNLYRNRKRVIRRVHKLVAETFIRPFAPDECTHHINRNKQDNRLSNLMIMTFKNHSKLHSPLGRSR